VIDLSGVELIDAAGLGALISVALMAQASQCSVKLAAPGNFIRELLELTKLTSIFEVHLTLDAATIAARACHDRSLRAEDDISFDQPDRLTLEGSG
jgi:anti-anti-sigma regulatory factor